MTRVIERILWVHRVYAFDTSVPSNETLRMFLLSPVQT